MNVVHIDNKMEEMKLNNKDVGLAEDMIFAIKNLIAIEDHSATSFGINNDKKWIELIDIIRKIRTKWISTLIKKEESLRLIFSIIIIF